MALEATYEEVSFTNESTCSGTSSASPAAPREKSCLHNSNCVFSKLLFASLLLLLLLLAASFLLGVVIFFKKSQCLEEKKTTEELIHTKLECMVKKLTKEDAHPSNAQKVWSCCPKNWKSFGSNCYFVSTESKSWSESERSCSQMGAHLLVINSKAEQDFIIKDLNQHSAYYVGLSDPEGQGHWQWVDQTPYNESISFWHPGKPNNPDERFWHPNEPNNPDEQCVTVNFRSADQQWGWNDVHCDHPERSVCKMMEIYL
ncbi:C-type lectin domain family 4 member A [Tupaia chinensis]|uniref:C-type lectin domain family 4 member A n=1 Tax=Tupaia chinensis TaxID=246437 RepID=L9KYQ5_TUPCH|nr:C-type lectin domain family 4 member A [Tupaia chinensis]